MEDEMEKGSSNKSRLLYISPFRQQVLQRLYQHLQLKFSIEHCFSKEKWIFSNFLLTAVKVGDRFVNAMGNHQ